MHGGDSRCEDSCKYVGSSHEQLTELTTSHDKTMNMLQNAALCCKKLNIQRVKLFTSMEKEHFDIGCLKILSFVLKLLL